MTIEQALPGSCSIELPIDRQTVPHAQSPTGMNLRNRKLLVTVWATSYGIWIFIAFMTACSMHRLNLLFWKMPGGFWDSLKLPLVNNLIYATLSPVVLLLALRYPIDRATWKFRVPMYVGGAVTFAVCHAALRMLVYPVIDSMTKQAFPVGWSLFMRLFLYNLPDDCFSVFLAVVVIAHAMYHYKESRSRELRASQLETRLAQAQLRALKSQLQPHFLFNTLHSISALMLTNVSAADAMLARLSELLRLSLDNNSVQETTLNREVQFVEGYLEIERMRFGDRLQVRCDVDPDTLDAQVPHLLLQPLVENAIRHGASRRAAGGEVWIVTTRRDDDLVIEVGDNGPGFSPHREGAGKHGVGLNATRERLRVFYGDRQSLDIHSAPDRGTIVRVKIPWDSGKVAVVYELEAIHGLR
jgi:signal transduction histidine kinase